MKGYVGTNRPESWEEAILCGNGTLGVIALAEPYKESLILSHEKLFFPLKQARLPVDTATHLSEIRSLFASGEFKRAAEFVDRLAAVEGYEGKHWTDPFLPAGELVFEIDDVADAKEYRRSLDFATGLGEVTWSDSRGDFARRVFASRADNVVYASVVAAAGDARMSGRIAIRMLSVEDPGPGIDGRGPREMGALVEKTETYADGSWLCYRAKFRESLGGFEIVVRVLPSGGSLQCEEGQVQFSDVDRISVLIDVVPLANFSRTNVPQIQARLSAISADFDELFLRHAAIHSSIFDRVSLSIRSETAPDEDSHGSLCEWYPTDKPVSLVERVFYAGRYHVLSSTGELPPHLQGVWAGDYRSPWSSDYTQNGNVQTVIASMLPGHMFFGMDSYLSYMESLVPDFRVNAWRLYRSRGIHVPSRTSTHGFNNHFHASYPMTFWTAGAGWAARFFYDYWLFSGDDEFLHTRALPFMREAAQFYEDFLTETPAGVYEFVPSYSPENTPMNSDSPACINAAMDIAVCRELLTNLLIVSRTLGVEQESQAKWECMLQKLPPYRINEDGILSEWACDAHQDNYDHRHASHLYHLYYGVTDEVRNDEELRAACAAAYKQKTRAKAQEAGVMGFGSIQIGMAAAHLGDGETVEAVINELAPSFYYSNYASAHNAGPDIFNADVSGGLPALIMEALVQSEPALDEEGRIAGFVVSLLPALPPVWTDGQVAGIRLRGGFEVELEWKANRLTKCLLQNHNRNLYSLVVDGRVIREGDKAEEVWVL